MCFITRIKGETLKIELQPPYCALTPRHEGVSLRAGVAEMTSSDDDGGASAEPLAQRSQALFDEHACNVQWLGQPNFDISTMPEGFPGSALRLLNRFTAHTETDLQKLLDSFAESQDDPIAYHACFTMLNMDLLLS